MDGIDKIIERLKNDARSEIAAINTDSEEKCAQLRQQYEKQAQEAYSKRISDGMRECRSSIERQERASEMAVRNSVLAFKQEMVSAAFQRAVSYITEMPREKYIAFLAGEAAKASENGMEELVFNARDAKDCAKDVAKAANALLEKKGLPGKLTVAEETRDIAGGLIVKQGDIEVNCAVETLLQVCRNELASQVAEILFA